MKKLKQRWGIETNAQLWAILTVFAFTGSTATKLSGPITEMAGIDASGWYVYWPAHILIIFPIYQVLLLVFAWLYGEFPFFWEFEKKMLRRMGMGFLSKNTMLLKHKTAKIISAIGFATILFLPVAIQFLHALQRHEHIACTDTTTHLHEKNPDCSLCDFHKSKIKFSFGTFSDLESSVFFPNPETPYFSSLKSNSLFALAVRGPPHVS